MVLSLMHFNMAAPTRLKSLMNFNMAASTRLKCENAYILWGFQLKLKALTAMRYGSDIQEIYLSIWILKRVVHRSTCGLNWNLSHMSFKQFVGEHPFCVVIKDPRHERHGRPGIKLE